MLRLLGYVYEHHDAFSRPLWLCPQETWAEAERLGYIEKGATRPFIAREGSYFQAWKLSSAGYGAFFTMMRALEAPQDAASRNSGSLPPVSAEQVQK